MCGIAGAIGWIDERIRDTVALMTHALDHRGPDDSGQWCSVGPASGRGAAFGHRRLSIVDLSPLGHQPMVDPDTGCVITFNGEVYNFNELRQRLIAEGMKFVSRTDTEVILKAYTAWGPSFVDELRGMFALALWDPRKRHSLLVRDRLGIKPLYVTSTSTIDGTTTLFASEVRALLATGLIPRKLDPLGLTTYLWNGFVVGPGTIIQGISLLPAGCSQIIGDDGRVEPCHRYWSLPLEAAPQPDSRERLAATLVEAIKMRLVADVPLGVFLSGGIDSTAVAAVASRVAGDSIKTFNVSFEEAGFDESSHARSAAQMLGTEHREVRLTQSHFHGRLADALASLDQPTFDAINTYFISRAVREEGLTVALAGTGGDEVFGGYSSFVDIPRVKPIAWMGGRVPYKLRTPIVHSMVRARTGRPGPVPPQSRWGKLEDVLATRGDVASLYQVSYGLFTRDLLEQMGAQLDIVDHGVSPARMQELRTLVCQRQILPAISDLELSMFLGERLLRDTDTASMAVALEVRVPLIDHVALEVAAELDPRSRYGRVGRKEVLRTLSAPQIPSAFFDRPKSGFELPLELWIREGLRSKLDQTFRDTRAISRIGLNARAVGLLWDAYLARAPGLYWSRVWSIFILINWAQNNDVSL